MKPTLRQLEAFVQVYRLGSLTRAAQALHLTQSAMSVLVRQLEEGLGLSLFDRSSRRLQPTRAAHHMLPRVERILADTAALSGEARDLAELRRGDVHVGVATAVAATLLPVVIQRFRARYPGIRLHIHDAGPERLLAPVLAGEVAFSIGTPLARHPDLRFDTLLRDPLVLVCSATHVLASTHSVTWQTLAHHDIITVAAGNGIRTVIDQAFEAAGLPLSPAWEVSYLATALALTRAGLGVSVLPAHLINQQADATLTTRRLGPPHVYRDLFLIALRDRALDPAAAALAGVFAEVLGPAGPIDEPAEVA